MIHGPTDLLARLLASIESDYDPLTGHCARCDQLLDAHPGGFCPDQVVHELVEVGSAESFTPRDGYMAVEAISDIEDGVGAYLTVPSGDKYAVVIKWDRDASP